MIYIALIS